MIPEWAFMLLVSSFTNSLSNPHHYKLNVTLCHIITSNQICDWISRHSYVIKSILCHCYHTSNTSTHANILYSATTNISPRIEQLNNHWLLNNTFSQASIPSQYTQQHNNTLAIQFFDMEHTLINISQIHALTLSYNNKQYTFPAIKPTELLTKRNQICHHQLTL